MNTDSTSRGHPSWIILVEVTKAIRIKTEIQKHLCCYFYEYVLVLSRKTPSVE